MKVKQDPERIGDKLRKIRRALHLSQKGMVKALGFEGELIQGHISTYERKNKRRIPPLGVVLQYARLARIPVEVLIDDNLDLPAKIPADEENIKQIPV